MFPSYICWFFQFHTRFNLIKILSIEAEKAKIVNVSAILDIILTLCVRTYNLIAIVRGH